VRTSTRPSIERTLTQLVDPSLTAGGELGDATAARFEVFSDDAPLFLCGRDRQR
jgi:hypothetical protein